MEWFEKMMEFKDNDEVGNGKAGVTEAWETLHIASESLETIKQLNERDIIRAMDAIQIATNIISTDIMDRRSLKSAPIPNIFINDIEL